MLTQTKSNDREDSWRVMAWMIGAQLACLSVGIGLSWPEWFFARPIPNAVRFGAWLILSILTLSVILIRFAAASRRWHAESHATTQRIQSDLIRTQQAALFGLAHLSESRDPLIGQHLLRIRQYTRELTEAARQHPKFQHQITPDLVDLLADSSLLHDIGKVGIADQVLLKPGPLTPAERQEIQRHPLISGQCLRQMEQRLGASNFLQLAHEIALHHHERWDGGGYPHGLRGEAIPLSARIVAIADVYDALSSERVYKSAMPHAACVEQIRAGAGSQFDADLVDVFVGIAPRFAEISRT